MVDDASVLQNVWEKSSYYWKWNKTEKSTIALLVIQDGTSKTAYRSTDSCVTLYWIYDYN